MCAISRSVTVQILCIAALCAVSYGTTSPPLGYCSVQDDPHMLTFDGSAYEMQLEGVFFLYKHKTEPIWVQAVFQSCGVAGASCSCAAAVRYYGEAFVVDKCVRSSLGRPVNTVFRSGSGASMNISLYFAGFQVQLPNGLRVHIARYDVGVRNIDIRAIAGDENLVEGLCGVFNNNNSDDFTWRAGGVTSANETYPYTFADSWRVQDGESLFDSGVLQLIAPCTQTLDAPRGPAEVADSCQLGLQPADLLAHNLPPPTPATQIGSPDYPDGVWPTGWSHFAAVLSCYGYVATGPAQQCSGLVAGEFSPTPYIANCVRDIYLTGDTSFAIAALNSLMTRCMQSLLDHSIATPSWLADFMCPFNCGNHGTCLSGLCYCDAGWGGFHCGVDMSSPPSLLYYVPSTTCNSLQSGSSRCYSAYIFGSVFVSNVTLVARANLYSLQNPSDVRDANVWLSYITSGILEVTLRLPSCQRSTIDYGSNLTISNDGVLFSDPLVLTIASTVSVGKR